MIVNHLREKRLDRTREFKKNMIRAEAIVLF